MVVVAFIPAAWYISGGAAMAWAMGGCPADDAVFPAAINLSPHKKNTGATVGEPVAPVAANALACD